MPPKKRKREEVSPPTSPAPPPPPLAPPTQSTTDTHPIFQRENLQPDVGVYSETREECVRPAVGKRLRRASGISKVYIDSERCGADLLTLMAGIGHGEDLLRGLEDLESSLSDLTELTDLRLTSTATLTVATEITTPPREAGDTSELPLLLKVQVQAFIDDFSDISPLRRVTRRIEALHAGGSAEWDGEEETLTWEHTSSIGDGGSPGSLRLRVWPSEDCAPQYTLSLGCAPLRTLLSEVYHLSAANNGTSTAPEIHTAFLSYLSDHRLLQDPSALSPSLAPDPLLSEEFRFVTKASPAELLAKVRARMTVAPPLEVVVQIPGRSEIQMKVAGLKNVAKRCTAEVEGAKEEIAEIDEAMEALVVGAELARKREGVYAMLAKDVLQGTKSVVLGQTRTLQALTKVPPAVRKTAQARSDAFWNSEVGAAAHQRFQNRVEAKEAQSVLSATERLKAHVKKKTGFK